MWIMTNDKFSKTKVSLEALSTRASFEWCTRVQHIKLNPRFSVYFQPICFSNCAQTDNSKETLGRHNSCTSRTPCNLSINACKAIRFGGLTLKSYKLQGCSNSTCYKDKIVTAFVYFSDIWWFIILIHWFGTLLQN